MNKKAYTAKNAAKIACNIAFSDSHITMDPDQVEEAIIKDFDVCARFPRAIELEELIMGDVDGIAKHAKTFPNLDALLNGYWE